MKEKKQPIEKKGFYVYPADSFDPDKLVYLEFGTTKVYEYDVDGGKIIRNAVCDDGDHNGINVGCMVHVRNVTERWIKEGDLIEQ